VGSDSFSYKAFDGLAYSSAATVTIDVTPTYKFRVDLTGQGSVTGGLSSRTTTSSTQGSVSWSAACPDGQSTCDYEMDADKVAKVIFSCKLIAIPNETISALEADWVCNNLEALAGYEIETPDGEITFRAQNSITLGSGFKVESGGVFHAIME
jgi:hypothetical protein